MPRTGRPTTDPMTKFPCRKPTVLTVGVCQRMQSQLDSMKEAMDRIERTTKNLWMAMGARSAATKAIIEMY